MMKLADKAPDLPTVERVAIEKIDERKSPGSTGWVSWLYAEAGNVNRLAALHAAGDDLVVEQCEVADPDLYELPKSHNYFETGSN